MKDNKKVWGLKKQAIFFSILSDLLSAGFSLRQSLISIQNIMPEFYSVSHKVKKNLLMGTKISDALKENISKSTYYQLLIAEQHGEMEKSIKQLGSLLERRVEQQNKLKSLMVYPMILFFMLIIIMLGIKFWLKPTINNFGEDSVRTSSIINWTVVGKYSLILVALIIVLYVLKILRWWSKQETITRHHWYSQLLIIGKIYRQYSYYYLSFNLSLLLKSGLDLKQICSFLNEFDKQSLLYQLGQQLRELLDAGSMPDELVKKYPFIPPELKLFLNKGETLENISNELAVYSEVSYRKLLKLIDKLIELVQPILFIVIAIIIVGTYLTILLPIYKTLGGLY